VEEDDGANLIGFGPKVGIVCDRVAFALPVGFAVGEDVDVSETFTLQPTGLFTVPVSDSVDLNPSARLLIPTCEGCEVLVGVNLGVGIWMPNRLVSLRPEVAFLWNPGEEGTAWSFGVGVSFRTR
jgi:hypothetical protein